MLGMESCDVAMSRRAITDPHCECLAQNVRSDVGS